MKRKFYMSLLTVVLLLLNPIHAVAGNSFYGVLSSDRKTVTFYYDDKKDGRGGEDIYSTTDKFYAEATKAIFDASVAEYRPFSTATWFFECSALTTIEGLKYLNTSEVTAMNSMFQRCTSLNSLDLSTFDTSNVTNMNGMFAECSSLTSVDLSSFNTTHVTNMGGMFASCPSLTTIYADETRWSTAAVTNEQYGASDLFIECSKLVGGNGTAYNDANVNVSYACIDKAGQPGYLTHKNGPADPTPKPYAVYNDGTLTFYYDKLKDSRDGYDIGPFNTSNKIWGGHNGDIKEVVFDASFANCTSITSTAYWFYNCSKMTSINGIEHLNTQNVTNMEYMFNGCNSLTSLYLNHFDTDKVTNCKSMFYRCSKLSTIYCDKSWNENIESRLMFSFCKSLPGYDQEIMSNNSWPVKFAKPIDDGGFFTPTSNMGKEPYGVHNNGTLTLYFDKQKDSRGGTELSKCIGATSSYPNITSVVLHSSFADYRPTSTNSWFSNRQSLSTISGLENLITHVVADMTNMFSNCSLLRELNLSSFNTMKVKNTSGMFGGCEALTTIWVDDATWNTDAVTSSDGMFQNCHSLKGGNGTMYNENHTDATYSCIDQEGQPGYLTMKEGSIVSEPEPYAGYSDNTLTFFYDRKKISRKGYNLEQANPYWGGHENDIQKVVFDTSFRNCTRITTTKGWFRGLQYLTTIEGIENLNTSNVTDMSSMFYNCKGLKSLDLSHFDIQNVTDMYSMFSNCTQLESIDLSGWNVVNNITLNQMFAYCSKLSTIYCNNTWNSSDSFWMFYNCSSLPDYNGSNVNCAFAKPIDDGGYFTPKLVIEQCAKPVISLQNGELSFSCDTEGVEFVYSITLPESADGIVGSRVALPTKCRVSVYARKEGMENSETVTKDIEICGLNGDINCDGKVTVADAVQIINIIIQGQ